MIEIRTGDRRAAFEVPFQVYGSASPYVSPMWSDLDRILDPARNPLARDGHGRFEVFTAHMQGRAVGRIVAILHDASNRRHGTARGQFGFFDCADDAAVADALLAAAETWLGQRGAAEAVGNFNLTAMQMTGVLTEGFDAAPYTDMMWSPPHIAGHLMRRGYQAGFPMTTFETDLERVDAEAMRGPRQARALEDSAFTWHPITRTTFKQRLEDARQVLNAGFDRNPMFVPVSREEYAFQAGEMMWIMDPRLSVVVHHQGRPAGVIVCIPDLNPMLRACGSRLSWSMPWHFLRHRLTRDRAVIIYYAVIPELHGQGLNGAMLGRLIAAAKGAGYRKLGTTWIADENKASLRQMQRIGAKPLHRLNLFARQLRGGVTALSHDDLRAIVAEVRLAPSVHNIQPSRWRLRERTLELLGDTTRTIPVADPAGRDWYISHGTALEGLELALNRRGLAIAETRRPPGALVAPDPAKAGPLVPIASLTLKAVSVPASPPPPIATRVSWRGGFRPIDGATGRDLDRLAAIQSDLQLVRSGDAIGEIARLADRAALYFLRDAAHRRELRHWMRLSTAHPGYERDGLNAQAMQLGAVEAWGAGLVLGPLFMTLDRIGLAAPLMSEATKTRTAAAIAVFHRPAGEDPVQSGRAFYRAWLAMEANHLKGCPVSVLADWPVAREDLDRRHPVPVGRQIVSVFRIGRPDASPPLSHARLPVDELIV